MEGSLEGFTGLGDSCSTPRFFIHYIVEKPSVCVLWGVFCSGLLQPLLYVWHACLNSKALRVNCICGEMCVFVIQRS